MGKVCLRRAAFCLGIALATVGGCSASNTGDSGKPDYEALRIELQTRLASFDGWSTHDDGYTEIHAEQDRRARVENLLWRSFTSKSTGTTVRLTLVGGHRRDVHRYVPSTGICLDMRHLNLRNGAVTAKEMAPRYRYDEFKLVSVTTSGGAEFRFTACRKRSPDDPKPQLLLMASTLDGAWTPNRTRALFGASPQNTYGFVVHFEVDAMSAEGTTALSSEAEQLIAKAMNRLNSVAFDSAPSIGVADEKS
ncbi:MAG: hypothetical protein DCC68_13270 [Planctomycetota bacterium]|nr:MAG: hypothetical protein DCC68_13270 [Planctomycetota bacterium]